MSQGYFITGTDTDVGKTFVTAALLHGCLQAGISTRPLKPVQSGCEHINGRRSSPDLDFALQFASLDLTESEKDILCPNKFPAPCSPHLAAKMDEANIDWDELCQLPHHPDVAAHRLLIEGAGGLLVPIDESHFMLDLIRAYAFPVVLVARATLGTINHTLLSVQLLQQLDIEIAGIVLNHTFPTDDSYIVEDNLSTIQQLTQLPVYGPLPYIPQTDVERSKDSLVEKLHPLIEGLSS